MLPGPKQWTIKLEAYLRMRDAEKGYVKRRHLSKVPIKIWKSKARNNKCLDRIRYVLEKMTNALATRPPSDSSTATAQVALLMLK